MRARTSIVRSETQQAQQTQRRGGFALLITLTLLSLLVLLLVGLLTFTKIETQISDNTTKQTQARQNALMALNIALGQLQKHAGLDARVTATADAYGGVSGTKHYTGIWDTATTGATTTTWLVSGSETGTINPASLSGSTVELVGVNTSGTANDVLALKQPIKASAVPGQTGTATVGNYAWWVGDQGVKASIGLPDLGEKITYSPWSTATLRRRIRQQIAGTPNYFRNISGTQYGFDPLSVPTLSNVTATSQLQFISPISASSPMGVFLRTRFHDVTAASYGVLANTRSDAYRGLQRDLSLNPSELGDAYAAYANYSAYMETPAAGNTSFPSITSSDSPRRRYVVTPPITKTSATGLPNLTFGVAPVLSDFLLQFKFNRTAANVVTVSSRLYVALWNPYTAALVPPSGLTLEVTGLPQVTITSSTGSANFNLGSNFPAAISSAGKMSVSLPFTTTAGSPDRMSWLPGRLYCWVTPTGAGAGGALTFYNKNANATGWSYIATAAVPGIASNNTLGVSGPAVSDLKVTLKSATGTLATYTAPSYAAISQPATTNQWKFAFAFRADQPLTTDTDRSWLQNYDPRSDLSSAALRSFDPNEEPGSNPNFYVTSGAPVTSQYLNAFLLYRTMGASISSLSADNDVPLFELPRQPFLSVGELQHLQVEGARPFSIGNPWGGTINAIFDRYFFSGLPSGSSHPDLSTGEPLPNWNMRALDTRANPAIPFTIGVVRENDSTGSALYPLSSRYLLQGGAFNVNSTSQPAWRTMLSSVRFNSTAPFLRADIDNASASSTLGTQVATSPGTVGEIFDQDATLGTGFSGATFLRFPQSAQETYFWNSDPATHAQAMNTQAFRQGVRGYNPSITDATLSQQLHYLTTAQVETLATTIVGLVATKASGGGPFRSMEEFLSPNAVFGGKSLLEKALGDASINASDLGMTVSSLTQPGFSSLTLTQADIMTALAPYLRTRSDTFLVRTYGDVVNPATGATESSVIAEAMIQRLPSTVDSSDDPAQPSLTGMGRRFKIVSLRWLSSTDI